jgi:GT2 family glycosyltransferase
MKLCLGIPTLNRYDLLKPTLELYKDNFRACDMLILDNGRQQIPERPYYHIINMQRNLGVAKSWNVLSEALYANGNTHVCLLNDDVVWHKNKYEVEQFLKENPGDFYMGSYAAFTIFIMPQETYKTVGPFDPIFYPAYYEDNDYVYRLKLKNKKIIQNSFFDADVFRCSETLKKDPSLENNNENRQNYIAKWGGGPGEEKFRKPYNL